MGSLIEGDSFHKNAFLTKSFPQTLIVDQINLSLENVDVRLVFWWGGSMAPVRTRHSSHDFGWQSSHSVDIAGWQAKNGFH